MSDREKVITGLECCSVKQSCLECPWKGKDCNDRLHLAALELLKEQPEIVQCKDCKHWDEAYHDCSIHFPPSPDWFCADGERRGGSDG